MTSTQSVGYSAAAVGTGRPAFRQTGGEQPVDQVAVGQLPPPLQVYKPTTALLDWARAHQTQTVPQMMKQSVAKYGDAPFLGRNVNGTYQYTTYREAGEQANQFASGLIELGMRPGDRVGIVAANSPEWMVADLGTQQAACVDTPVFGPSSAGDIRYALQDSGARVVIAGNEDQLKKIISVEKDLPYLQTIVTLEPTSQQSSRNIVSWQDVMARGKARLGENQAEIDRRTAALKASDIATIVYTSGSTGAAKGTMLMHGNLVSSVDMALSRIKTGQGDTEMSLLPLSHVFERSVAYAVMSSGAKVAYGRGPSTFMEDLQQAHPTVLPLVPQVYEKMRDGILANVAKGPGWQKKVFAWAHGVGTRYVHDSGEGHVSPWLRIEREAAQKLVFDKVDQGLGGQVRLFLSGGAPLRPDVGAFFPTVGLPPVTEGYGMTEGVPIAFNDPDHPKFGTVGHPVDIEVKLADDGEIIVRGPNVMNGYLGKPEATAETLDSDDWLHTGDIGQFDNEGNLKIVDRKKNLIVLATGTKFAPGPVEEQLETSPFIARAVIVGEQRNFTGALIVPNFDTLRPWARKEGILQGPEPSSPEAMLASNKTLAEDPRVNDKLMAEIKHAAQGLSYETGVATPKQIAVLPQDFGGDELTAIQKIKRPVILKNHADAVESIYNRKG